MENYKSTKQQLADAKKRAGNYPVNEIKSVDKLPTPFKTDLNKKWLDATFDQMISKGDMEHVDAYVGCNWLIFAVHVKPLSDFTTIGKVQYF